MTRSLTRLIGAGLLLLATACAAPPRPPELVEVEGQLANERELTTLVRDAKGEVQQSRDYHAQAEQAYLDGETEVAQHYAQMAKIALDTARERSKAAQALMRIDEAGLRLERARKAKADHEERQAKMQKRVDRMEKILALQSNLESEQSKSKADKKALTAKLDAAKEEKAKAAAAAAVADEQRKKDEEERLKAEAFAAEVQDVRNQVAEVATKIQTAESLEAEKFDANGLRGAKDALAQVELAVMQKDIALARQVVATAKEAAEKAIEVARAAYAQQAKEYDVLAQRKALLEEAGKLGANEVKQMERGVVITLLDMFASQKSDILAEREMLLTKLAGLAKKYGDYPLVVEGYTDSRGNEETNLTLSSERARAVVDYFVQLEKLPNERVKSAGYGEANPVADNSTAEGRAKNRRIQVVYLFR